MFPENLQELLRSSRYAAAFCLNWNYIDFLLIKKGNCETVAL